MYIFVKKELHILKLINLLASIQKLMKKNLLQEDLQMSMPHGLDLFMVLTFLEHHR